jgi:hypothetical protein
MQLLARAGDGIGSALNLGRDHAARPFRIAIE